MWFSISLLILQPSAYLLMFIFFIDVGDGGVDVLLCVKSIVEQYPAFRPTIIRKIIDNLDEITSAEALRIGLWMLGEYADVIDPSVIFSFTAGHFYKLGIIDLQ
jgi:hypothetical protein